MRARDEASDAKSVEDQLIADIAAFELDPLAYVLYAFPWGEAGTELAKVKGPRKWQRDLLDKIGRKLRAMAGFGAKGKAKAIAAWQVIQEAVASGHGIGKSALIAMVVMWAMSTFEDTKIVLTANTETQLRTKTSPELAKWHRLAINAHWFTYTTTSLYATDPAHGKTWRADLIPWSEHNTEAFQGLHNEGKRIVLVFDEGSAIADKVWEVAEGALTDANTQIIWLAFGNPTRTTGRFRECFRKYKHRWGHSQIDSRTVEGINHEQIAKWVTDYGEDSDFVKIRVRGMFPSASATQFINETDVDAAYGRKFAIASQDHAPKILTVDPSWTGEDEFVVGMRQGLAFRVLRVIAKNDDDVAMANMIGQIEDEERADAVFIDFAYGTGIVSVGRTLGREWLLVNFGGESSDAGCLNKRAEMYKKVKLWLKEGGGIEKDPQLHTELTSIETIPRLDEKLQLEDKRHIKQRIGLSPGRADALALSFAFPVRKKDRLNLGVRPNEHRAISDYDPLAEINA